MRRWIAAAAGAVLLAGCGSSAALDEAAVEQAYLEWQEQEYGALADTALSGIGAIESAGECAAANVTEDDGDQVTVVFRNGDIVDVVTGHLADRVDPDQERCWS